MNLKNAAAVCLISLFSATLVVLIARSLDSQTAARLEPQLARIVEELEAIRQQNGISQASGNADHNAPLKDGLMVYYFHGNTRCPTCRAIESQAHEAVDSQFSSQLARGELVWKVLNYEHPSAAELKGRFDIEAPVVVLARMEAGKIRRWKRLDEVWALWDDKPKFIAFVGNEIRQMLATAPKPDRKSSPANNT